MRHTQTEAAQRSAVVAVAVTAPAPAVAVEVEVEVGPEVAVEARAVLGPAIVLPVVEAEPVFAARVEAKRSRYELARLSE